MIIHFLYTPFTGLGLRGGYRGDNWLKNRIRVFKEYVLPSLMNQSKREFTLWISWRPEEKDNPIVQDFMRSLEGMRGLAVIHTFHGLCFYDDMYDHSTAKERLKANLKATLPELREAVGAAEKVLMTIQPSDDMYLSHAVDEIQYQSVDCKSMAFEEGYLINYATKEMAEYNPTTIPPFSTVVFTPKTFLDYKLHYEHTKEYKSHEDLPKLKPYKTIQGRGFVVGTHGANISTTWNIPFKGRDLTEEERDAVLIKTNTLFAEPIVMKQGLRLFARKAFNKLPSPIQNKIRDIYHNV